MWELAACDNGAEGPGPDSASHDAAQDNAAVKDALNIDSERESVHESSIPTALSAALWRLCRLSLAVT